jgi:lipid-A-disaccharide synthase
MLRIALIAGEASGDMLAANLIQALKNSYKGEIELAGIGGPMLEECGLKSWHNLETLSVMGYLEVIKSLPQLIKLRYLVLHQLLQYKPDIFIGVDAPDFNFFLEQRLHNVGIKTAHYISPTIWAWRYSRIYKIKKSTDLMLCIFPFEEALYHQHQIAAKFIGHPVANSIEMKINRDDYRRQLNLPALQTIICILSGSRKREVQSLAKTLIETCALITAQIPNCSFVFPFANQTTKNIMEKYLAQAKINFTYTLFLNNTQAVIKAADLVIAKSGTVSLEAALCKKPMLICYKVNRLSAWFLKRKLTIKYVGQPNIIAGHEIVKEFLQEQANPRAMSQYIIDLYNNPAKQAAMVEEFNQLHLKLKANASIDGAQAILDLLAC